MSEESTELLDPYEAFELWCRENGFEDLATCKVEETNLARLDDAVEAYWQQHKCKTCDGRGEIGGPVGQTPESFEFRSERCPDCRRGNP